MDVPPLDDEAMTAAYEALARRHGKLDGLAVWLAGVQGAVLPHPLARRRVVVFGASDVVGDVTLGTGSWDDGVALADREVDGGADVAVVVAPASAAAVAVVAALARVEPVDVVASGRDWAAEVAAVRDVLRDLRGRDAVATAEAAGLGAAAGFVAQAARRRTPVVLDGVAPAAAALAATDVAPGAAAYLMAGHLVPGPAHRTALDRLGLAPLLDLGITADGGALLALPLLDAAVALLTPPPPRYS